MPTTKVLRSRGAKVLVEAYGEVLFTPGQDIPRWTNRFARRITSAVSAAAPGHNYAKRPLRPHDRGVRLKQSFTSTVQENAAQMRVDAAVGSRAPYSAFVDQGTGIYNPDGGSPYEARVLPPWREGEGSLYESTWTPGKRQVAPVMIRGQVGQRFMEAGLDRAFLFMTRRAAQLGGAEPRVGAAMNHFPEFLALRGAGNTPVDAAFIANLQEWRSWRDTAFRRGDQLGQGQREGRTRKGYEAARAAYSQSRSDLATSKANADRRAQEQAAALVRAQQRKAEGQAQRQAKKRAADARDDAQRKDRDNRQSEAGRDRVGKAVTFANGLRRKGLNPTGRWTTNEKGQRVFRVVYTQNGLPKRKDF